MGTYYRTGTEHVLAYQYYPADLKLMLSVIFREAQKHELLLREVRVEPSNPTLDGFDIVLFFDSAGQMDVVRLSPYAWLVVDAFKKEIVAMSEGEFKRTYE